MRRVSDDRIWPLCAVSLQALKGVFLGFVFWLVPAQASSLNVSNQACQRPVYLTFDTGHMGVAPLIADVLKKQHVPVTFFAAQEKTQEGDGSLGQHWAPWWAAQAKAGHDFASHTYDHAYWRADLPDAKFKIRPSAGSQAGQDLTWDATTYCANLKKSSERLEALTGRPSLPLFRAPGGKTSPALLKAASDCGYAHVAWAPAGFLGDELSSQTHTNDALLKAALKNIRSGDILMAHLGIWSRQDPWAPAVLEPLIVGLKAKGFCFASLRQHPQYSKLSR
jgi:peptidoglycan/xylan/chitin deacetylase (PgdA/CDA1 family)